MSMKVAASRSIFIIDTNNSFADVIFVWNRMSIKHLNAEYIASAKSFTFFLNLSSFLNNYVYDISDDFKLIGGVAYFVRN